MLWRVAPPPLRSQRAPDVPFPPALLLALLHWVWFSLGWCLQPPPPLLPHFRPAPRQVIGRQTAVDHLHVPGYSPLSSAAMGEIVAEMAAVYRGEAAELVAAIRQQHRCGTRGGARILLFLGPDSMGLQSMRE